MSSPETYKQFARYYDWYVSDHTADLPLYQSFCQPEQRVLEIGCGTGRVLRALLEKQCQVTGVDISDEMLRVADAKLHEYISRGQLELRNHDFRSASIREPYDRIFVTFFTFNYLLTTSEQRQFLRHVHQSLSVGGLLVLHLFCPKPLANPDLNDQWQETTLPTDTHSIVLREKRKMAGKIEERIQVFADGGQQTEILTRRIYINQEQIGALLAETGFEDCQVTSEYNKSAFRRLPEVGPMTSNFFCLATKAR